jgi:hypothetical protein
MRTRNRNRGVSPAGSDDDIAIERERISLNCPLTLTLRQWRDVVAGELGVVYHPVEPDVGVIAGISRA